jgi:hypothetical protein
VHKCEGENDFNGNCTGLTDVCLRLYLHLQSIFVFPFPGYLDTITGSYLNGGTVVVPTRGAHRVRSSNYVRCMCCCRARADIEDFVSTTTFLPRVGFLLLIMQYTAAMHTER